MFTHFYSDPHFGHKGIIDLCGRPYQSVEQMNEALISNYNAVVGTSDTVLWVGDAFFMSFNRSKEVMDRLNGVKCLVRGNHDRSAKRMVELGFASSCEEAYIDIAGRAVRVCHYPYSYGSRNEDERTLPYPTKKNKEEILMHGHTHSSKRVIGRMIHVGVDAWDFTPASLKAVTKQLEELT